VRLLHKYTITTNYHRERERESRQYATVSSAVVVHCHATKCHVNRGYVYV